MCRGVVRRCHPGASGSGGHIPRVGQVGGVTVGGARGESVGLVSQRACCGLARWAGTLGQVERWAVLCVAVVVVVVVVGGALRVSVSMSVRLPTTLFPVAARPEPRLSRASPNRDENVTKQTDDATLQTPVENVVTTLPCQWWWVLLENDHCLTW